MNKERITAVANAIEARHFKSLGFNMGSFINSSPMDFEKDKSGHNCGTVACLAGHTVAHAHGLKALKGMERSCYFVSNEMTRPFLSAMEYLDLTPEQAKDLFIPEIDMPSITLSEGITAMKNMRDFGEAKWKSIEGDRS